METKTHNYWLSHADCGIFPHLLDIRWSFNLLRWTDSFQRFGYLLKNRISLWEIPCGDFFQEGNKKCESAKHIFYTSHTYRWYYFCFIYGLIFLFSCYFYPCNLLATTRDILCMVSLEKLPFLAEGMWFL